MGLINVPVGYIALDRPVWPAEGPRYDATWFCLSAAIDELPGLRQLRHPLSGLSPGISPAAPRSTHASTTCQQQRQQPSMSEAELSAREPRSMVSNETIDPPMRRKFICGWASMLAPRCTAALAGAALALAAAIVPSAAADPVTIRIGYPGVGADNRPFASGDIVAVAHAGHYLDEEFAHDPNVKIEWTFFRGAGPALNESLAAGQLDFAAGLGDLPAIVGRANGLQTHYLLTDKVRDTIYLAVRPSSGIHRIEDLAGHRLSEFKGTNLQLAVDQVLAAHGLSERNVRFINLDTGGALAALNGGSIDGTFGSIELLGLRDRGIVELPYNTKAESSAFGRNSAIYVTDAFEKAHPALVQRVVDAFVRAARFGADESNRNAVFALWAKSGFPEKAFAEDFADERLAHRLTPLIDPYVVTRYRTLAARVHQYGLIRRDIDVDSWFEPKYLDAALKDQHLEQFWPQLDATGQKTSDGAVEHTIAAQK